MKDRVACIELLAEVAERRLDAGRRYFEALTQSGTPDHIEAARHLLAELERSQVHRLVALGKLLNMSH
jgi:hypothetical protein